MSESENTYSNEKNLYKMCHLLKTRRAETVTVDESKVIKDFIGLFNNSSNQLGGGIRDKLSLLWNRTKDAFTGKEKLFDNEIEKVEISEGNTEEGNTEEGNIEEGNTEEGNIEEGDNKGSIASGVDNENVAIDFLKCFIDSPIQNEENDSDIKLDLDIYFCKLENSDLDIKIQSKLYKHFLNKYEEHEYLHDILKIIKLDSFNCDIIIAKTNDTWVPDFITTKFNLNNNLQKKLLNAVEEYRKERNDLYKSKYFDLTYNESTDSTDENVDIIKSIALNKEHIDEFDKNIKEIYVNFGKQVKEVIIRIKKHIYKSLTENDKKIQLHCANDKAELKKEEEDEEEDGEASSSFKASPESFSVEYGHNYIPVVPNKVAPDAEVAPAEDVVAPEVAEVAPAEVAPAEDAPPLVAPPPVAPPPDEVAVAEVAVAEVAPPEVAPPEVAPAPAEVAPEVAPAAPPKELIGGRKNNKKSKRKSRGKPKRKTKRNQ